MSMYKLFAGLVLVYSSLAVWGQDFRVVSSGRVATDLSARTEKRLDLNGRECGLVKVNCILDGISFEGNVVGEVGLRNGVYWVYLTSGSKELSILHPRVLPLHVSLREVEGEPVEAGVTYNLTLGIPDALYAAVIKDAGLDAPQGNTVLSVAEDSKAMQICRLGDDYYNGNGVPQDYDKAVTFYQEASKLGCDVADYKLGDCYYFGKGVKQDYKKALEYYYRAAEQGNADAQFSIGICYRSGHGVKSDTDMQILWYKRAAEQGNVPAMVNLGVHYYYGDGVPQDYEQAVRYYRMAGDDVNAQQNLAECYMNGYGVDRDLSKARDIYLKALKAKGGNDSDLMLKIGNAYFADGTDVGKTAACGWFEKAADLGNKYAARNLGVCHYNGWGVAKDPEKGVLWLRKAADLGNDEARDLLKTLPAPRD